MTENTEKKILDAALNVFAKKGRDAATTKAIAEKAGRTEMTLFRKFGSKKNLFDQVMIQSVEKMQKDIEILFSELDQKYDNPKDFLNIFIKKTAKFYMDNIEAFTLILNDDNNSMNRIMGEIYSFTGKFLERNIPHRDFDYKTMGIYIFSFIYAITLERYQGRSADVDYKKSLEKFQDNLALCVVK
ncbi:MAG: putative DNA-binding transcriptional regulator [Methanobacterium sp. PtaU1.Bin242]|nr:MAG: putative DNA-binding transcriptional regulator [Methanobacterium sp. PtaU1.Bin242]